MGWYARQVLPRIINRTCGIEAVIPVRRRVCQGLAGEIVEIGFGSGLNVPYYPAAVTRVAAVEPSDTGWKLAEPRLRAARMPVQRAGQDGQALPMEPGSFDAALSFCTLCTIPDPGTALRELRRVLRPGGTLHFAEHGLAPDEPVRRWQRRLEPVHVRFLGGCHLTRPVASMLTEAGFVLTDLDVFYFPGAPRASNAFSVGIARSP